MLSVAVVLLLVNVASTFAQTPEPCVTPLQWTGLAFELDPSKDFERIYNISYDAVGQRIYTEEFDEEQETREVYKIWLFWEKNEGYRLTMSNPPSCQKFALPGEFRPFGIPKDATFDGYRYLGEKGVSTGTGIQLEHWRHTYALQEGVLGYFGGGYTRLRSAQGYCVPVLDGFVEIKQSAEGPDTLINYVHTNIYDVTAGINPAVFNIPPVCL